VDGEVPSYPSIDHCEFVRGSCGSRLLHVYVSILRKAHPENPLDSLMQTPAVRKTFPVLICHTTHSAAINIALPE